jgi:hypothetical protein
MIVSVFGDESHDETKQRVFALSGVLGPEYAWDGAVGEWLKCTKGTVFHAADAEHQGQHGLYKDLTQVIAKSELGGFTAALDLVSFHEFFPDPVVDAGYFKCFTDILWMVASNVEKYNSQCPPQSRATLQFTFDHRKQTEGNAGALYAMLSTLPEWDNTSIFNSKIAFDCRDNPRIQIADLVAREAMKELDRKITNVPPRRRASCDALLSTGRFVFVERDREYCENWRQQMNTLMAENGMSQEGFRRWLKENRRVQNGVYPDNAGTRLEYMVWLEGKPGLPPIFKKRAE